MIQLTKDDIELARQFALALLQSREVAPSAPAPTRDSPAERYAAAARAYANSASKSRTAA